MISEGYKDTEVGVIPIEWDVKKLDDISELTSSKRVHLADYVDIGIPFYRGKEITLLKKNETIDDLLYISEEQYNKIKNQFGIPKKNDILITAVGTLANIYRIPNDNPFYFKDGNLIWLKGISENSIFIDYILGFHKKQILDSAIGSSQKALTIKELKKIKIPLPSLKEQERIADILSTADDKIDAIQMQINRAETLKKGLLQKLLSEGIGHSEFKDGEFGKMPLSWDITDLDKATTYVDYRGKTPTKTNSGVFLVTARNIKGNKIDYSLSNEYIAEDDYETVMSRGKPQIGDVLLTTEAPLGEIATIDKEYVALAQRIIKYRGIENYLDNSFLKHYFISSIFQNLLLLNSTGSTVKGIKGSRLKKLKIPIPSIEEQKQIADILSTADEKLEVLRAKKQKYEILKKGLLQKLLSGEVRV